MASNKEIVHVPLAYRILFLYFEPFAAFFGTWILHYNPAKFLNTMSPDLTYAPDNQVIYDNLGATYALFAFNEAVLLRLTNDLRVWRGVLVGILLCDSLHLYASWAAIDSAVFWDPHLWRPEDWANLGSLWGQAAVRVAFLLGVGLNGNVRVKTE